MNTLTGLLISPDGDMEQVSVEPDAGSTDTHLSAMYDLIGCRFVDLIRLPNHLDAWIDDEAYGSDPNIIATMVCSVIAGQPPAQAIRGKVLLLETDGRGGSRSIGAANLHRAAKIALAAASALGVYADDEADAL